MPTTTRFKLPDVGEGLTEAEILSWEVKVGDTVEVNQILCEIETAKSAVELPSPVAGVIDALHAEEGDTVEVGDDVAVEGALVEEELVTQPRAAPGLDGDAELEVLATLLRQQALDLRRRGLGDVDAVGTDLVGGVDLLGHVALQC